VCGVEKEKKWKIMRFHSFSRELDIFLREEKLEKQKR
jgi:hypothetical protein